MLVVIHKFAGHIVKYFVTVSGFKGLMKESLLLCHLSSGATGISVKV